MLNKLNEGSESFSADDLCTDVVKNFPTPELHGAYIMSAKKNESISIDARIKDLGFILPEPVKVPSDVKLPFSFIRVRGNRVYISGHGPQNTDGTIAQPRGKVGKELTLDQGYQAARLTALSILGNLKRELGELDRVTSWLRVFGMVNAAPGFNQLPQVINGFSDLILELYGPDRGAHARSAAGLAELPFDMPVEIEAEVEIT